jgi:hypothetical protein
VECRGYLQEPQPSAYPCTGAYTDCNSHPIKTPQNKIPAGKTEKLKNLPNYVRNLFRDDPFPEYDPSC